jgi:hypothetical protein
MTKYLKPYLKVFLTAFLFLLPVGIPLGCWFLFVGAILWPSFSGSDFLEVILALQNNDLLKVGLVVCLLMPSIIIAGLMALSIGTLHVKTATSISTTDSKAALETRHTRTIQIPLPYRRAFELCTLSLNTIDRCQIRRTDHSQGTIEAKTGISWKTFGDIISFKISPSGTRTTQVEVTSRPTWRTVIVDYGRNLEHVERIAAFLNKKNRQVRNQTEGMK